MRIALIAVALAVTGCAPKLAMSNEAGGVINKTGSAGTDRAYALATDHCAKFGKIAKITSDDILTARMRFDCVAK